MLGAEERPPGSVAGRDDHEGTVTKKRTSKQDLISFMMKAAEMKQREIKKKNKERENKLIKGGS